MQAKFFALLLPLCLFISACTYNPFVSDNRPTGNPAVAIGAAAGSAGAVGLLGGTKPVMVAAGLAGGLIGYYMTTLRYDSGPIIQAGGQVYTVGDFLGIYIPTDKLFEPNTAELLPTAGPVLQSAATVLQRYPSNNVLISGNTSGFGSPSWEKELSQQRAAKVAAYLWAEGVNNFDDSTGNMRKLGYVGYGDYYPIASSYTNKGIRANSRIQIASYPDGCDLGLGKREVVVSSCKESC